MKKVFINSFRILKNNLLYIQPLILYLLIFVIALSYLASNNIANIAKIFILVSVFLLAVAFLSGWLHINKLAVCDYNPDDDKETISIKTIKNLKTYFIGVGENFLKIFVSLMIFCAIWVAFFILILKLGLLTFGKSVIFEQLPLLAQTNSQADIINYLNTVSDADKIIFIKWVSLGTFFTIVINFIGVLYLTVVSFEKTNPVYALFKTAAFGIKNLFGCINILCCLFVLYVMLNFIYLILGASSFGFCILVILFTLYLNYYLLLVFCFYNEKTRNNSNNRTELIGENSLSN